MRTLFTFLAQLLGSFRMYVPTSYVKNMRNVINFLNVYNLFSYTSANFHKKCKKNSKCSDTIYVRLIKRKEIISNLISYLIFFHLLK